VHDAKCITAVEILDRAIAELTMLSYILISKPNLTVKMKIPSFRIRDSDNDDDSKAKTDNKKHFVCKECKMTFQSKDSLELHKKKARHYGGLVYFGKSDS
jgi:transposase-like protein